MVQEGFRVGDSAPHKLARTFEMKGYNNQKVSSAGVRPDDVSGLIREFCDAYYAEKMEPLNLATPFGERSFISQGRVVQGGRDLLLRYLGGDKTLHRGYLRAAHGLLTEIAAKEIIERLLQSHQLDELGYSVHFTSTQMDNSYRSQGSDLLLTKMDEDGERVMALFDVTKSAPSDNLARQKRRAPRKKGAEWVINRDVVAGVSVLPIGELPFGRYNPSRRYPYGRDLDINQFLRSTIFGLEIASTHSVIDLVPEELVPKLVHSLGERLWMSLDQCLGVLSAINGDASPELRFLKILAKDKIEEIQEDMKSVVQSDDESTSLL